MGDAFGELPLGGAAGAVVDAERGARRRRQCEGERGGTDGEGTDPTATEDTLAKLYPAYPFDENPVIVPKISTVPTLGTDAEPAAFTPTETEGEVQQASTTIEWEEKGI